MSGTGSTPRSTQAKRRARIGVAVAGVLAASVFAGAGAADAAVLLPADSCTVTSTSQALCGPLAQPNGMRWQ